MEQDADNRTGNSPIIQPILICRIPPAELLANHNIVKTLKKPHITTIGAIPIIENGMPLAITSSVIKMLKG